MIQPCFATNRCGAGAGDARFTADPSGQLAFGLARVSIPIDRHRLGHVEQRASWNVLGDPNDERRYVVLDEAVDTSVLGLGLGHSYFADPCSLLTDIGILVGAGLPASQRGLAQSDRPRHWYFPR
ncbi:MAG TPA: hypothetical protein PK752_19265 [Accumulibacter sp.]|uniref:hypothetical protein n=1 Tax=Accumulibacter sp. TaxID=2053492 RepID=UPI002BDA864F|nr:hypothetical protein [Accumulibacter sp.]HRD90370.1 hypothetical protein [Accumulibacter sp.]